MPYGVKVAYMVVTYLLWGSIFYTSINIPYGSMASAISPDPTDRASLSTWRSVGASLASLVIGTGTPLVAYVTVDGNPVLSGSRMTIIAGVFSVLAVICIAIRIAYKKNGKVFVRSGAGIVADSVPEKEYEECINKARSSLKALKLAQEAEL